MATLDEQVVQLLTVLCSQGAYWARCTPETQGVSAANLLTLLQAQFPATDWDADLLEEVLQHTTQRGSVTYCTDATPRLYYARRDMARVNPRNEQYRDVCDGIYNQLTQPNIYWS